MPPKTIEKPSSTDVKNAETTKTLSPTRQRDLGAKRQLYLDANIAEYWIVDAAARHIRVVRSPSSEDVVTDTLTWTPKRANIPLVVEIQPLLG